MERLGIYIIYFFIFGLVFFERVRTQGDTGSIWRLLGRNVMISISAFTGFLLFGHDLMFPAPQPGWEPFSLLKSIINYAPYGETNVGRFSAFENTWLACVKCVAATVLVAAGIWELRFSKWNKWLILFVFSLLVYPLFGKALGDKGFIGQRIYADDGSIAYKGVYDHAKVLLVWALPAAFILGSRLVMPSAVLPAERRHDLKGVKILPGMKHRFLLSRGIGFIMIFLVLNTPSLDQLSTLKLASNDKALWVISKTFTLLPASFVTLFANILFFGLFGKNKMERISYAPPFFAIMAVLVSSQACNQYDLKQTLLASTIVTFSVLLFLRLVPLHVRIWDPTCSIAIFLAGSVAGILVASITDSADFSAQLKGVLVCVGFGAGAGAVITFILRSLGRLKPGESDLIPDPIEDEPDVEEPEAIEEKPKKRFRLPIGKNKP